MEKAVQMPNNVKIDRLYTREFAVERIVGHTKKNARTRYLVQWYGYTSDDVIVRPPEHLKHHFIARYGRRIGRRATTANAQTSE